MMHFFDAFFCIILQLDDNSTRKKKKIKSNLGDLFIFCFLMI